MCKTCQTNCGHVCSETRSCKCGCGCGCIGGILNALENLFSTDCCCHSTRSACNTRRNCCVCSSTWYGNDGSCGTCGFGSCGTLNACSDAYYARQYALGYQASCSSSVSRCEDNPCGGCRCHCCRCRQCDND